MSSPDERRPSTFLRLTPDTPIVAEEQQHRPWTFLSLAPDTSSTYPRVQTRRSSSLSSEATTATSAVEATAQPVEIQPRRKSSDASGPRILKLGPVHWGEHLSENKDDFYAVGSP
ncbi:hypothetical protein ACRE_036850 [Hapsidospora chrysogenum ATCC 11550]|uniref:Uncharacterized protein n=1 Tax=Hapsidospora chrysogenum (strain ATCC 11550 / CBS 779.69 / DSM 880 / IAM 14645 / JCM 23072 / IMI 49137) TaxID=857340 RepID=A0A086T819_HAPC1|nr:hypothetical protein ACRE_036850 [Hapsidospora chrysogenum ATCC 11550]